MSIKLVIEEVSNINIYKDILVYLENLQLNTIEFIGSGRTKKNTEWIKEKHSHDYLEIIYFLRGKADIDVPGNLLHLMAFDMIVYPPGVPHHEIPDFESPQEIITIALRVKSMKNINTSFKFADCDGSLRWLFEQINKENDMKNGYYDEIMKNYFKVLIFYMRRYYEKNKIEEQDILSLTLHYIQDNYYNPIDIKKLISLSHISESYLSRLFVKKIGLSPIVYLNFFRIEIAKKILVEDEKPIKEIALQVGFKDPLYFSRAFKKMVKVTPSKYRENEKKNHNLI